MPAAGAGAEIEATVRPELLPVFVKRPFAGLHRRELLDTVDAILDSGRPLQKCAKIGKAYRQLG